MISTQRMAALVSVLVLLLSASVHLLTLTPTVPFWDSGEYIAVATILGVPHPPGTPFYVLLGRIATLVPWASVAQRVNALSAIAAALAVWFTYLSTLRLIRLSQGAERKPWHEPVAIAAAATGALLLAFSDAFWENSIEAEVYQLMSLAQILVFWLGLRWWEAHDRKPTVGPLLLATYVMWLCVGLHLGVGIMGAPLLVLVFLVDRQVGMLFLMPFLSLLRVPAGLEKSVDMIALLSAATLWWLVSRRKASKLAAWLASAPTLVSAWEWVVAELAKSGGREQIELARRFVEVTTHPFYYLGVLALLFAALGLVALRQREGRVLALALFVMVAGYSTHLYLPIRAAQHPAVNEGAPATWTAMRDLLERRQYGEMNPFVRRGTLASQLDKEFLRYFRRQWVLVGPDDYPSLQASRRVHAGAEGPAALFWNLVHNLWLCFPPGAFLPLALGLLGGWWQYTRERRSWLYTGAFLGLSTVGMIVFLNFSNAEVRDRDYFFQSGFHAYALWIGLGVARLVEWVRESFEGDAMQRVVTAGAGGLLALQPFLLMANHWHTHDRSGNYIARDYAYNMLATLAPNSFMFTNGDNDTFPLWYIQEVEGFRKDVRIVNLSLLNTDWYIRQLRDEEPKVPIALDERTVDVLGGGAFQDEQGRIIMTNEYMVHHILEQTKRDTGWVKQPYFAVTVPNDFGYGAYFRQQGIVQEVMRDSLRAGFDEPATRKALYETFRYRGLVTPDGSWDPKVFKDENAQNLSRNYAFAHMQLALHYRRVRDYPKAVAEMERVQRMFPEWVEIQLPLGSIYLSMGDTLKAWEFYDRLAERVPGSAEAQYYRGAALAYRGMLPEALTAFRISRELDPNYPNPYFDEFATLWDLGRYEEAIQTLQRWVDLHPDDQEAQLRLQEARRRLGLGGSPLGTPVPGPGIR
jgi:hypothetical protein